MSFTEQSKIYQFFLFMDCILKVFAKLKVTSIISYIISYKLEFCVLHLGLSNLIFFFFLKSVRFVSVYLVYGYPVVSVLVLKRFDSLLNCLFFFVKDQFTMFVWVISGLFFLFH